MNRYIIYANLEQSKSEFWKELFKMNEKDAFKKVQKELWAIHDQTTPRQQHFKVYQLNKNERIKKVVLSLNNVCEVIVLNTKFYLW